MGSAKNDYWLPETNRFLLLVAADSLAEINRNALHAFQIYHRPTPVFFLLGQMWQSTRTSLNVFVAGYLCTTPTAGYRLFKCIEIANKKVRGRVLAWEGYANNSA
jgi:hypothetical protein